MNPSNPTRRKHSLLQGIGDCAPRVDICERIGFLIESNIHLLGELRSPIGKRLDKLLLYRIFKRLCFMPRTASPTFCFALKANNFWIDRESDNQPTQVA